MKLATVVIRSGAGASPEELTLRAGADLVARVHAAPAAGGRGAISLAGVLLAAELPPGLEPGQRLPVRVVRIAADEVVLRLHDDSQAEGRGAGAAMPRLAGTLAVSGDPHLVQGASLLQQPGLALPLPNGDALLLAIPPEPEPDEGPGSRRETPDGEAAFVLHSAMLGPIEVRLRLAGRALAVDVAVEPAARETARAAAPELVRALERALAQAEVRVAVASRARDVARPSPPRVEESFDAYA